jgi:hypothetical protein
MLVLLGRITKDSLSSVTAVSCIMVSIVGVTRITAKGRVNDGTIDRQPYTLVHLIH